MYIQSAVEIGWESPKVLSIMTVLLSKNKTKSGLSCSVTTMFLNLVPIHNLFSIHKLVHDTSEPGVESLTERTLADERGDVV